MRYRRKNHFLKFRKISSDRVVLENYITKEKWEVSMEGARFLQALNGRRNPYEINPGLSRALVDELLEYFEKEGWLDEQERIMPVGIGSILCTLYVPDLKKKHKIFARIWNRLLMMLCLPLLIAGVNAVFQGQWHTVNHGYGIIIGNVIGLLAGTVFHELSHACACLSYGGYWFEGGVLLEHFLPGAYVCMEYDHVKNRFQRAQISAAGVECNFMIAGIFLLFLEMEIFDSYTLIFAALTNVVLGVFNLSLIEGLDGMGIYSDLLGVEGLVEKAKLLIWDRKAKRTLRKRGISGNATIVCCYIVAAFQVLLPMVLILNLVSILRIFIS